MSITLDYTTLESVPPAAFYQMKAESDKLLETHDWWAEPLSIMHDARSRKVAGSTRIFLGSYSTATGGWVDVTEGEDYLLACNDARVIVRQLERWSKLHSVSWTVEVAGDKLGTVANGTASDRVAGFVSGLCQYSKLPESNIPLLLKKFENRKEPPPQTPAPSRKRSWWKFWDSSSEA